MCGEVANTGVCKTLIVGSNPTMSSNFMLKFSEPFKLLVTKNSKFDLDKYKKLQVDRKQKLLKELRKGQCANWQRNLA